ncbi:MAG UNVERIFIED_CONTAM: hypothetical protein LVR18_36745 [Planctomycetaceae bacterium]
MPMHGSSRTSREWEDEARYRSQRKAGLNDPRFYSICSRIDIRQIVIWQIVADLRRH